MKKFLVAALAATLSTAGFAAPIGFNGTYDASTWSSYYTGATGQGSTSTATTDAAQQTLVLTEPDGSCCSPVAFNFSHTIAATGTLSFDWAFNWDTDACCSGFNVYINGTYITLANGNFGDPGAYTNGDISSHFSAAVTAGDVFTFEAFSEDGCCRAATTTITNFDAPDAVPEPAMLGLFGLGAIGLGLSRRRRA